MTLLVYGRGSENKTALVPELVRRSYSLGGDTIFPSIPPYRKCYAALVYGCQRLSNFTRGGRTLKPDVERIVAPFR